MSVEKQIKGVVTQIIGNRLIVKATSAEKYDVETGETRITKRNGTGVAFAEIQVGDKVEVVGGVWPDNSVNARTVRVVSLYVHAGTFFGRVESVNLPEQNFTMRSSKLGLQTIQVSPETLYAAEVASRLLELEVGMTVQVKGVWERNRTQVLARRISARMRLLNIDITGQLVIKGPDGLTVTSAGVMYAVNIQGAKLLSKNNKPITITELSMGQVRVKGKHIAESPKIVASVVKDLFTVV